MDDFTHSTFIFISSLYFLLLFLLLCDLRLVDFLILRFLFQLRAFCQFQDSFSWYFHLLSVYFIPLSHLNNVNNTEKWYLYFTTCTLSVWKRKLWRRQTDNLLCERFQTSVHWMYEGEPANRSQMEVKRLNTFPVCIIR
jgi:hypothetical protein